MVTCPIEHVYEALSHLWPDIDVIHNTDNDADVRYGKM
jgi:hypothetical protein